MLHREGMNVFISVGGDCPHAILVGSPKSVHHVTNTPRQFLISYSNEFSASS